MSSTAHLLVALDVETNPTEVCAQAAKLAALTGGEVTLLYVAQLPPDLNPGLCVVGPDGGQTTAFGLVSAEARARMEPGAALLEAQGLTVHCEVERGDVVPTLWQVAQSKQADLVVVGFDLAMGLRRAFSVGFTEAILREATCPVAVVKPSAAKHHTPLASLRRLVTEDMG